MQTKDQWLIEAPPPPDWLNRRAEVEQELLDCANGKQPLPDAEKCRALAMRLGVPSWAK